MGNGLQRLLAASRAHGPGRITRHSAHSHMAGGSAFAPGLRGYKVTWHPGLSSAAGCVGAKGMRLEMPGRVHSLD